MAKFQVVEKDDFGTDWHQVRYEAYAMQRFDTEEEAVVAAEKYLTHVNCDNSLTKEEKRSGAEAFMMTKDGCFLGVLDRERWYMTDRGGNPVGRDYFELEGKAEIAVREVPGT
jgi:hypothetical protein